MYEAGDPYAPPHHLTVLLFDTLKTVRRAKVLVAKRREQAETAISFKYTSCTPHGRLDANGGQISGFCGHTFHLHIVYLQTLLVRNQAPFLRHEQLPIWTCV